MKILHLMALGTALLAASAAFAADYKVGDLVASPDGFNDKYYESVVIAVDPTNTFEYRVHPLGFLNTMDESFMGKQLHAVGSVPMMPQGGILNDPWLLKVKGIKAYHPTTLYRGKYECVTLTDGELVSAAILNFEILDAHRYRDLSGNVFSYSFDANSSTLVFHGGGLNGQVATYEQTANPPAKTQPPTVTFKVSGDSCQPQL
ncbi:MAG TPA: hypothetical protein VGT78_07575 [Rhizomicrobium sp.]|nr:hypothetical protein [Rhizomicrobium sp.]